MGLNWDDLRFVLALRREGSLGGAARALKCEQSTASRRLAAVETALGVRLASRAPEGLMLNEAGLLAADIAQTIDERINDLQRRIGGAELRPEGVVRLSTTESFVTILMEGLASLRQEHPKIELQLVVANGAVDLLRGEADVALRMFRETNPNLISRKIGEPGWSIYGSPAYLERTGFVLGDVGDGCVLAGQAIVGYSGPAGRSAGARWLDAHSRPEDVVLRSESVTSVAAAVRAGLGLSVLPCFAVGKDGTNLGVLKRVTAAVVARTEAFLVIPPDHRQTVRVRLVMDAVAAMFERDRAFLAGDSGPP